MKKVRQAQAFLSVFYSLAIVLVVKLVAYAYFLKPAWDVMEQQGILRAERGGQMGMYMFLLTVLLGVWAALEIWKKADDAVDATYFGFLIGVVASLPEIANYFFYQFQWQVPVVAIVANIVGFSLAGWAYGYDKKRRKK